MGNFGVYEVFTGGNWWLNYFILGNGKVLKEIGDREVVKKIKMNLLLILYVNFSPVSMILSWILMALLTSRPK